MLDDTPEVTKLIEDRRQWAQEQREAHDARQDRLSAQAPGAFCPAHAHTCMGLVEVDGLVTQCPYEGGDVRGVMPYAVETEADGQICPHWLRRQQHVRTVGLRRLGFSPEASLARWQNLPPEIEPALRLYCKTIGERLAQGHGLIISGQVGNGKTSAMALVAASVRKPDLQGRGLQYVEAIQLLEALAGRDADLMWGDLENAALLLIDDLGTEYGHERTNAKFHLLMDRRWAQHRSTIITTNLSREELSAGGRLSRLLDRWQQRAPWLVVMRGSQRKPMRVQDWEVQTYEDR